MFQFADSAPLPFPGRSLFSPHRSLPVLSPHRYVLPTLPLERGITLQLQGSRPIPALQNQVPESPPHTAPRGWAGRGFRAKHPPHTRLPAPIRLGTWLNLQVKAHWSPGE